MQISLACCASQKPSHLVINGAYSPQHEIHLQYKGVLTRLSHEPSSSEPFNLIKTSHTVLNSDKRALNDRFLMYHTEKFSKVKCINTHSAGSGWPLQPDCILTYLITAILMRSQINEQIMHKILLQRCITCFSSRFSWLTKRRHNGLERGF